MIALLLALLVQNEPALLADTPQQFTDATQTVDVGRPAGLQNVRAMTVGVWVLPKRRGEQLFFFRGRPEAGPNGERTFKPNGRWVNFMVGTDEHGFLMGAIHGNGSMPFPYVTLSEVPIDSWSQLVLVKDADGFQSFYRNGILVASDRGSCWAPAIRAFNEIDEGDPACLSMPLGGTVGEAWVYPRGLSVEEIRKDFDEKRDRYAPALPAERVILRAIDEHPGSWKAPITPATWPGMRTGILEAALKVLGPMPTERVDLDPKVLSEEDCGTYVRRKVSIQVQAGDRMPAYVLVPKGRKGRAPAIVCFYGTTSGAGKDTTVGLSGAKPGTPPDRNRAFAVDMVEAGYVAFAADYLRDGERIAPGKRPYDTTDFYEKYPDWSVHGKDAWDTMRAIDYLQTLDVVDPDRIGMVGHSYGGHSTIFTTALEPRIKACWANGPVSDFLHHGMHWGVPKGGTSSQSLPAMRPYLLDRTLPPPLTFYEFTSLIAPRALAVGQAVGERRPMEEENAAAVGQVYRALGAPDRVRYVWYPGDHDFPPHVRKEAVEWFQRWLR